MYPEHLADRAWSAFEQVLGGQRVWSKVAVSELPRLVLQADVFPLEQEGHQIVVGGILRDITAAEFERRREQAYRRRRESQYMALTKLGTHPELLGGHWDRALKLVLSASVQNPQGWKEANLDAEGNRREGFSRHPGFR